MSIRAVLCSILTLVAMAACGCKGDPGAEGMQGPQGPAGPMGPGPAPVALAGVTPSQIFTGRTTRVVLTGDNTNFDSTWTVDASGGDVGATLVSVASPTALVVDLAVLQTAVPGTRDLAVSLNDVSVTLAAALEVVPPLSATFYGATAQGAVVPMRLLELDQQTPIGPRAGIGTTPSGVLDPLGFTFDRGQGFELNGLILIRRDAPTGMISILLDRDGNGFADDTVPAVLNVATSTAITLTSGNPTAGLATTNAPSRYEIALTAGDVATAELTHVGGDLNARLLVVGPGGGSEDVVGVGGTRADFVAPTSGNYEVTVYDQGGEPGADAGFTLAITRIQSAAVSVAEVEPNDTIATAQPVDTLPVVLAGSIATADDVDVFSVIVPAQGRLIATTLPGSGGDVVDTEVSVVGSAGLVTLETGEPAQNDDAEVGSTPLSQLITAPLAAGTYDVVVRLARGRAGNYTLLVASLTP